ncbi:hypothetical protein ACFPAA_07790, partial [Paraburkholderia caffeinitolerans]
QHANNLFFGESLLHDRSLSERTLHRQRTNRGEQVNISQARDQLNRNDDNLQDVVSKARESTQAAFVDVENAQFALKKLKEAQ